MAVPTISFIFVFTRLYCVFSFFLFNLLFICSSSSLHLCSMETLCCTSVSNSGLSLYILLSIHFLFIVLFFRFSVSPHCACLQHRSLCCSFFYSTKSFLYLDIWSSWFILKIAWKNYSKSIVGDIYLSLPHSRSYSLYCWMLRIEIVSFS